jgi:hypothetical protein
LLIAVVGLGAYAAGKDSVPPPEPPKSIIVEKPRPSVVLAIQSLARLQSVAYHMEKIIDLTKKEQALWGLVETHDNILLVAVGDVEAGIDLGKIQASDITADEAAKKVRILLPPTEVFAARLDSDKTYVHSRRTDVLGKQDINLETAARQSAEQAIRQGAIDAGILQLAEASAINTVRSLAQSLGYEIVIVEVKPAGESLR